MLIFVDKVVIILYGTFPKIMLYIVATPIGNLQDITIRALKILRKVDYIFAEDTRVVKKLLGAYKIFNKKVESLHKFNEIKKTHKVIELLGKNIDVAVVSDAGTPLISDPGKDLIKICFEKNIEIIPVPGVSALTTILSVTPFDNKEFVFVGFLDKSPVKREKRLVKLLMEGKNIFFFEAPTRFLDTLKIIEKIDKNLKLIVGRELTKKFEEIIYDRVKNLVNYYSKKEPKGEFTAGIENTFKKKEDYEEDIEILKKLNFSNKEIINFVTEKYKISKNKVYNLLKS